MSVVEKPRKPLPCIFCGAGGKVRCSVCKAWYCGKSCQADDWYSHKKDCSPPPILENPDNYSEDDIPERTDMSSCRSSEVLSTDSDNTEYRKEVEVMKQMHPKLEVILSKVTLESSTDTCQSALLQEQLRRPHISIVEKSPTPVSSGNVSSNSKYSLSDIEVEKQTRDNANNVAFNDNGNSSSSIDLSLPSLSAKDSIRLQSTEGIIPPSPAQNEIKSSPAQNMIQPSPAQNMIQLSPAQNKIQPSPQESIPPLPAQDKITQESDDPNGIPPLLDNEVTLFALEKFPPSANLNMNPDSNDQNSTTQDIEFSSVSPPQKTLCTSNEHSQLSAVQTKIFLSVEENSVSVIQGEITATANKTQKSEVGEDSYLLSLAQNFPCLSNALKLGNDYEATISLDDNEVCFYVQVFIEKAMNVFSNFHNTLANIPIDGDFKPHVGCLVAALSPEDESWYRAFIWEPRPDGSFSVCYIDYGNSEIVFSVQPLPEQFAHIPGLLLVGLLNNSLQPDIYNLLGEKVKEGSVFSFKVIDKKSEFLKVSLRCTNLTDSVELGEYVMMPWYSQLPVPDVEIKYKNISDVTFASSLVEKDNDMAGLEQNKGNPNYELVPTENMSANTTAPSLKESHNDPSPQDSIPHLPAQNKITQESVDGNMIPPSFDHKVTPSSALEKFPPLANLNISPDSIDQNATTQDLEHTSVSQIKSDFPPQKTLCTSNEHSQLSAVPTKKNSISVIQGEITATANKTQKSEVGEDSYLLSLAQNFPCLSNALKLGNDFEATISLDDNEVCFYAQVFIEKAMNVFSNFHNTLANIPIDGDFKPHVGCLVAALSPEDESWYRAFIWEPRPDGSFSVCYIDYGNSEIVFSVQPLPEQFAHIPGLLLVGLLNNSLQPDIYNLLGEKVKEGSVFSFKVIDKKSEFLKVSLRCTNLTDSVELGEYVMMPWYSQLPVPDVEIKYKNISDVTFASSLVEKDNDMAGLEQYKGNPNNELVPTANMSANTTAPSLKETHYDPSTVSPEYVSTLNENVDKMQIASVNLSEPASLLDNESSNDSSSLTFHNVLASQPAPDDITHTHKRFWERDLEKTKLRIFGDDCLPILPVWVDQENNVYIHINTKEKGALYESLQNAVNLHCEKGKNVKDVEVGELVCGFVDDDDIWYRAKVTSINTSTASVQFIDFGNSQELPLSKIKEFSASLMEYPVLCVKVQLQGVKKDDKDAGKKLHDLIESQATLLLKSGVGAGPGVQFFKEGKLVNDTLMTLPENVTSSQDQNATSSQNPNIEALEIFLQSSPKEFANNSTQDKEQATTSPNIKVTDKIGNTLQPIMYQDCKTTVLEVGGNADVFILEPENPFTIFLVPHECLHYFTNINEMSSDMEDYCGSQPYAIHRPILGEICLARFSQDNKWYRATCMNPEMDSAKVLFVDFGNSEYVPHTNIRQIQTSFLELPCMAIHCIMSGLDRDNVKDEASARLAELIPHSSRKTVNVLQKNEDNSYIIDIPEIKDILVAEGLVKPKMNL